MSNDVKWHNGHEILPLVSRILDAATFPDAAYLACEEPGEPHVVTLSAMMHATVTMLCATLMSKTPVPIDAYIAGLREAVDGGALALPANAQRAMPVAAGTRVTLTVEGRTYRATLVLASPNGKSLAFSLDDGAVRLPHGVSVGGLALSQDDDGTYRELLTGTPVTVVRDAAS